MTFSRLDLHRIRAHLLHYASLLDDFKKSVLFVLNNRNPAMDCQDVPDNGAADMLTKEESAERLKTECNNLLSEIGLNTFPLAVVLCDLLLLARETRDVKKYTEQAFEEHYQLGRHLCPTGSYGLQDVHKPTQAFSTVNIEDSKTMQELTTTALRDSHTMKRLTHAAVQDSAAMKQIA